MKWGSSRRRGKPSWERFRTRGKRLIHRRSSAWRQEENSITSFGFLHALLAVTSRCLTVMWLQSETWFYSISLLIYSLFHVHPTEHPTIPPSSSSAQWRMVASTASDLTHHLCAAVAACVCRTHTDRRDRSRTDLTNGSRAARRWRRQRGWRADHVSLIFKSFCRNIVWFFCFISFSSSSFEPTRLFSISVNYYSALSSSQFFYKSKCEKVQTLLESSHLYFENPSWFLDPIVYTRSVKEAEEPLHVCIITSRKHLKTFKDHQGSLTLVLS